MKKLKNLFVALALCAPLTVAAQDIVINEENFPDENFRNYLLEQDYGADGVITEAEIAGITRFAITNKSIASLKGIEHFTALTRLSCSNNQLVTLDVTNNTALTELSCNTNQLTALDVSNNKALTSLWCQSNRLTTLDVSNNTALTTLYCNGNQLTALDLSNNKALTDLACNGNQLTTLDVSNNKALTSLNCSSNPLTALDVSNNTVLTSLDCHRNQIKGESMDALVSSLPETPHGELYVYSGNPYDYEGNVITKSQVAAAKAKGWTSYYTSNGWEWQEYEGSDDEATRIALLEIENGRAAVYTLDGQKVTTPQKGGIYIVNGKKIVVK